MKLWWSSWVCLIVTTAHLFFILLTAVQFKHFDDEIFRKNQMRDDIVPEMFWLCLFLVQGVDLAWFDRDAGNELSCISLMSKTGFFSKKCLVFDMSETCLRHLSRHLSGRLLSLVVKRSPCLCVFGMFLRTQRCSTKYTEFLQLGNLLERRPSLRRQQKYSKVSIYKCCRTN